MARTALRAGATWLGVARVEEALELRRAGLQQPLLILSMIPYAQIDDCIARAVSLPLASFEAVQIYSHRAQALGHPLHVHLKIDTGMGRLGVLPEEALALARRTQECPLLVLEGVFSHLAKSDCQEDPHTGLQIRRFEAALAALHAEGIHTKMGAYCQHRCRPR